MTILFFMTVVKRLGESVAVEERPPVPSESFSSAVSYGTKTSLPEVAQRMRLQGEHGHGLTQNTVHESVYLVCQIVQ
jgi:hypothetical protein